jgi:small GTP-binding protein
MSPTISPDEPIVTAETVKLKVCMAGEAAVGKTSLIRRYVLDEYDDRYVATLGTKVSKKSLIANDPLTSKPVEVHTILWDVMGTRTLRELLKEAYYHGAQGILAVADLSREETLAELDAWARSIRAVAGEIPTYVVVNKADLEEERAIKESEIDAFCHARRWPWSYTSAKSGKGVEDAFRHLVDALLNVRADSLR